jgi:hypothetical protein
MDYDKEQYTEQNETGTFEPCLGCFILSNPSNTRLILKHRCTLSQTADTCNEVYLYVNNFLRKQS